MNKTILTALDRNTYRTRLLNLTKRLSGSVTQLEAEALRPTSGKAEIDPPAHEADPAVRMAEEDVTRTALVSQEQILAAARTALTELDEGTFGKCERCGRAISKARLDALPYAQECTRCARAPGGEPSNA